MESEGIVLRFATGTRNFFFYPKRTGGYGVHPTIIVNLWDPIIVKFMKNLMPTFEK